MSELDKALAALRESRDALKAELEADVRWQHLQRLESAVAALEGAPLSPAAAAAPLVTTSALAVGRPPASDFEDRGTNPLLLKIFAEDPNRVWRVEDLLTEMNRRGWETDATNRHNALGTALLRMSKRGEAEKVGRGRYRAALASAPSVDRAPSDKPSRREQRDDASVEAAAYTPPAPPLWSRESGMSG